MVFSKLFLDLRHFSSWERYYLYYRHTHTQIHLAELNQKKCGATVCSYLYEYSIQVQPI